MSQVHRSGGRCSSGTHSGHLIGRGGGGVFSGNLSELGLATSRSKLRARHHNFPTGGGPQRNAPIASQLLRCVTDAKTPVDKAARIAAATTVPESGSSHGAHHHSGKLKILGGLRHQMQQVIDQISDAIDLDRVTTSWGD